MDALVNSLMEELNCETVFTIPIFGGIPIYESVVVTWIIMAVVIVLCILLTRNLSVEHPGRRQIILETAVNGLNNFFRDTIGENGKQLFHVLEFPGEKTGLIPPETGYFPPVTRKCK